MSGGNTFSDSWHRVAGLHLGLRPSVEVTRQIFRDQTWFVLRDPFSHAFFRMPPEAYAFAARLSPERTVESVWQECLERFPETALGQEDVITVLAQLNQANLLYFRGSSDTAATFDRHERRRRQQIRSKLLSILYMRIPLFDPDSTLNALRPLIDLAASPIGLLAWLAVVGLGTVSVIGHYQEMTAQTENMLAPGNWIPMILAMVLIKTIHELGHAMFCKRFGGDVHAMGVMLLILTPVPFCDATDSWSFRNRWHRMLVGAGGMIAELFVAGIAAMIWSHTGPGLVHGITYNMIWIASVSTLAFNINPLVRFDGYYMLSDALDIPNLQSRSWDYLVYLVEYHLFGYQRAVSPAQSGSEALQLFLYAVLSGSYRLVLSACIVFFIAEKYLLLGILIAVGCGFTWFVVPAFRMISYLGTSAHLARVRLRATAVCTGAFLVVLLLLTGIPVPDRFRAPGVVESVKSGQVTAEAPGTLVRLLAVPGTRVTSGTPLVELENRDLEYEIRMAKAELSQVLATEKLANAKETSDLEPLRRRRNAVAALIDDLGVQQKGLVVKARQEGVWVAPEVARQVGGWIQRGGALGQLVDPSSLRFTAVVFQEETSGLFMDRVRVAEVRLTGQADRTLPVTNYHVIPFQQQTLPSAALGWLGGGEIQVQQSDTSGRTASEPFFAIEGSLTPSDGIALLHGRCGELRLSMDPQPILFQAMRRLRQLVQRRYRL